MFGGGGVAFRLSGTATPCFEPNSLPDFAIDELACAFKRCLPGKLLCRVGGRGLLNCLLPGLVHDSALADPAFRPIQLSEFQSDL